MLGIGLGLVLDDLTDRDSATTARHPSSAAPQSPRSGTLCASSGVPATGPLRT